MKERASNMKERATRITRTIKRILDVLPQTFCPASLSLCHSVPGQKGGTERLVQRYLSVPGQDVLSRDRKAGQNVWDRRAGTERLGTRSNMWLYSRRQLNYTG